MVLWVANIISSNVDIWSRKKTILASSAIPSALGKGSWSLALPKKLYDIMCCKTRVCKQPCKTSQRQVSVGSGPRSWQHLWVKGIATGGRAVACEPWSSSAGVTDYSHGPIVHEGAETLFNTNKPPRSWEKQNKIWSMKWDGYLLCGQGGGGGCLLCLWGCSKKYLQTFWLRNAEPKQVSCSDTSKALFICEIKQSS